MMIMPVRIMIFVAIVLSDMAPAVSQELMIPRDLNYRHVEGADATFRLQGRMAVGGGAEMFMKVLNYFGTNNQISDGLSAQEPRVLQLLRTSKMPGVLIYVEHQTSNTDVPITTLVGGQPQIIGPGLKQLDVWQASRKNRDLRPLPTPGYAVDESQSFFLWATEKEGQLEYGLSIPATPILNEARRVYADDKLFSEFQAEYDARLLDQILTKLEQSAETQDFRKQARSLLDSRQEALSEKRRIDLELQKALKKAAKAQKVAATFDTLAMVLTLSNQIASLASEFPEDTAAIQSAKTPEDLKKTFDGLMKDAQQKGVDAAGRYKAFEDKSKGIRTETLTFIRENKIEPAEIPGLQ